MVIEKNNVVKFSYEMYIIDENGNQHLQVENSKPLTVMFGRGNLLEPFENKLYGLMADENFEFTLLSADTFGPHLSKAVQDFSKEEMLADSDFEDMEIEVDMYLPMETEEGTPFNGKVVKISDDTITIDFNHPLAGKDLLFRGNVISVRAATGEELTAGKHISGTSEKTCKQ